MEESWITTDQIRTLLLEKFPRTTPGDQAMASIIVELSKKLDATIGMLGRNRKQVNELAKAVRALAEEIMKDGATVAQPGASGNEDEPVVVNNSQVVSGGVIQGAKPTDQTPFPTGVSTSG